MDHENLLEDVVTSTFDYKMHILFLFFQWSSTEAKIIMFSQNRN